MSQNTAAPRPSRTVRSEAGRGLSTVRAAGQRRDARAVARHSAAAVVNVGAALGDRVGRARVTCPACGWSGSRFRAKGTSMGVSWSSECPGCGAAARHRGLALVLPEVSVSPRRILHFAPEPALSAVVRHAFPDAVVETTDLERTDVDHSGQDIQALTLDSDAYDLVLCNHVLEHVPDDRAAMAELARVTAPGGCSVLTVPGDWDVAVTVEQDPPDLNGHFRHYGRDAADRLAAAFDEVTTTWCDEIPWSDPRSPRLRHEPIFVCRP